MKKIFLFLIIFFSFPVTSFARESVDYWYIKDFRSNITVDKDSTATIEEKIVADCGNASGKHGIYRVLPLQAQKTSTEIIQTPVELISVTDFNNNPIKYSEKYDDGNHTLTWKIGDPNGTVRGVNHYKITYKVKNIIRFDNPNFDEFYWNLSGNFWEMEIDYFEGTINFPPEVTEGNSQISFYTGALGSKGQAAIYEWTAPSILKIKTTAVLKKNEGVTLSVSFPKNIFSPYIITDADLRSASDWQKDLPFLVLMLNILSGIVPIVSFILGFIIWNKVGRDIKGGRSIAPEFGVPDNLSPIEMGLIFSNGVMKNHYISAGVINLAVKGYLKIEKTEKKSFLVPEDLKLIRLKEDVSSLPSSESKLLRKLFSDNSEVLLSSLANKFYKDVNAINDSVCSSLLKEDLIDKKGFTARIIFWVFSTICLSSAIVLVIVLLPGAFLGFMVAAIITFVFGLLMPRRTAKGLESFYKIKGFKLYMETAEKYRQHFNEKENIFEKLLPYAIVFGITGLWIKKMRSIYGQEYFNSYVPLWYAGGLAHFDADSLNSAISKMSSSMASAMTSNPSSSGAGGGGFSGGGGGGGGGGGW